MAQSIKEWEKNIEPYIDMERSIKDHVWFFRDPPRPQFIDSSFFFSPADGILINQGIYENVKDKILEIKGAYFTLQDLMQNDEFDEPCLVCSVFMTENDVHVNRIPMAGILSYKKLEPIATNNYPMLATQMQLMKGKIDKSCFEYYKKNERMLNTIYSPDYDFAYYVLQIADDDVDVIQHFSTDQNEYFQQNQRFSMIRWGSTCDLIIPLDKRYEYKFCQEELVHVEGGMDQLVEIIKRKNK